MQTIMVAKIKLLFSLFCVQKLFESKYICKIVLTVIKLTDRPFKSQLPTASLTFISH